jgi:hypothetical protein
MKFFFLALRAYGFYPLFVIIPNFRLFMAKGRTDTRQEQSVMVKVGEERMRGNEDKEKGR